MLYSAGMIQTHSCPNFEVIHLSNSQSLMDGYKEFGGHNLQSSSSASKIVVPGAINLEKIEVSTGKDWG
jgi:hypothetical protein